MTITPDVSLKPFNTFGIEVNTKLFGNAKNTDELSEFIQYGKDKQIPLLFLGGGSNILLTKNYPGLTVRITNLGKKLIGEDKDYYYVQAEAGEVWHELVVFCLENNLSGPENLSLIPGNCGAAPMQNIGAYGVELKDLFHELKALNVHTLETETFSASDCEFGYRESIFKRREKGNYAILSIVLKLKKIPELNTSYGAITKELEAMNVSALNARAISQAVINIRRSKLPDPKDIGNAGSFFKNPEVSAAKFQQLKTEFPEIVSYPLENGNYKLAAGWMIESCGWKGKRLGDAGVHKLQALVLVNYGNANGKEIYDLSQKVVESVKEKFDVELEREVNVI